MALPAMLIVVVILSTIHLGVRDFSRNVRRVFCEVTETTRGRSNAGAQRAPTMSRYTQSYLRCCIRIFKPHEWAPSTMSHSRWKPRMETTGRFTRA